MYQTPSCYIWSHIWHLFHYGPSVPDQHIVQLLSHHINFVVELMFLFSLCQTVPSINSASKFLPWSECKKSGAPHWQIHFFATILATVFSWFGMGMASDHFSTSRSESRGFVMGCTCHKVWGLSLGWQQDWCQQPAMALKIAVGCLTYRVHQFPFRCYDPCVPEHNPVTVAKPIHACTDHHHWTQIDNLRSPSAQYCPEYAKHSKWKCKGQ